MIPEIGQKFGPYEILGRVGGGGMGLVLRAWDERLHREVAIKLLYDNYQMPGIRERFLQEARAASKLSHPNICTIFDIGEKDGEPYLVMELLEGETLKEKIVHGALPAEEIVACAKDVAEALAVAHAKGIVHRDIKPANIFLVNQPVGGTQAKVLDFGLAKIGLTEDGGWMSRSLDLTLAGATVGTLAYMSPEQACGQQLDARSDLFSLGIVMYEMATRRIPFRGTTSALVYAQLLENEPEPVRKWNESIPKPLERLILKLLAKNRRDRFQSAKELRDALARIEDKLGKGGWLSKKPGRTAVPLVPAIEPVIHRRNPARAIAKSNGIDAEARSLAKPSETGSSEGNVLIRPRQLSTVEDRREKTSLRPSVSLSAVATDSGSRASQASPGRGFLVGSRDTHTKPVLARSRSGMNQFEFECDITAEVAPALAQNNIAKTRRRWKPIIITTAVIAVGVAAFLLAGSGDIHPVLLRQGDSLLLASIQNRTEEAALDGAILEGLEIDLKQSLYLKIMGVAVTQAGRRLVEADGGEATSRTAAQTVAQHVGAKAYLYGEIRRQGSGYILSVDMLDTQSNDKLTSVTKTAESREKIPAAIDQLSRTLRSEIGESRQSIANSSPALLNEATANIDALNAYFAGEKAVANGRIEEGLSAYQSAAKNDPKFGLAQIRLAWLYRDEGAEVASAKAAEAAQDATRNASDREKLLAEFCYEMNVSGDYGHALTKIRNYGERFHGDTKGLVGLARVLRAQGHMVEALLAAQQAYGGEAHDAEAYNEAELALIGLDRYDAALEIEKQAGKLGIANRNTLLAAYLGDKEEVVSKRISLLRDSSAAQRSSYSERAIYGSYLDSSGQMSAGAVVWKQAANEAQGVEGLASASASMLAQGALDNALAGLCSDAIELANDSEAYPRGVEAVFDAGMARALCGDRAGSDQAIAALQAFPHNTLVAQYYLPNLQAAQMFHFGQPTEALEHLRRTEVRVNEPLTFYLRGLVEASLGQQQQAAEDFRSVVEHRGITFLQGSNVYPFAELGLARALAASSDQIGSADAYRRFLDLWGKQEGGQALSAELR
jgi:eukaryotic-like serine/threonine-protein kinase